MRERKESMLASRMTIRKSEEMAEETPAGVKDARILAVVSLVLWLATAAYMFVSFATGERWQGLDPINWLVPGAFCMVFAASQAWLFQEIGRRNPKAWSVQHILAILYMIVFFPLGTIIYAFLLSKWTKPETKAWFGQA
jgi:hypothetical protein